MRGRWCVSSYLRLAVCSLARPLFPSPRLSLATDAFLSWRPRYDKVDHKNSGKPGVKNSSRPFLTQRR